MQKPLVAGFSLSLERQKGQRPPESSSVAEVLWDIQIGIECTTVVLESYL